MIESGEAAGVEAIAAANDVDRAYVSRILGLTALGPDLVESALRGTEPSGMSLAKLHRDIPLGWDEQRGSWAARAGF